MVSINATSYRVVGQRTSSFVAFAVAVLVCIPSVVLLVAQDVRADSATVMSATLPTPRHGTSAVWDGANAYIFGGIDASGTFLNDIVRYNPGTNTVTTMSATLPTGRAYTSAVWDGSNAYIFGGTGTTPTYGQIVRYNLATNTVTTMSASNYAWYATSAVWDGSNAYVFAGVTNNWYDFTIDIYNPPTDQVSGPNVPGAYLHGSKGYTSAVWDGTNSYVFGGFDGSPDSSQIERFKLGGTVTTMSATLPTGRTATSAIWDGANAYVFGGNSASGFLNEIVRYNPGTNTVTTMEVTLPTARGYTSAVWDGSNAYIFGGILTDGSYSNQIVRYNTAPSTPPSPPENLQAVAGPNPREITLTWQAPSDTGGAPITGYQVYRRAAAGDETLQASLGNVLSYTDTGLTDNASYTYRLKATNVAGASDFSESAGATTWSVPGAPRALTATPLTNAVNLSWQPPTSSGGTPITGYAVYRGQPGHETWLANTGNVLSYQDTSAQGGTRYHYRVSAINAVGEGPRSNSASARPYQVLLQTGPVSVPPRGTLATLTACEAGSPQGCQVPGSAFFCLEASIADGPATPLACLASDTVPAQAKAVLEGESPVQLTLPPQATLASASLTVAYLHERGQLAPWETRPFCDPIVASQGGIQWWMGSGADTALELRAVVTGPTGPVNLTQSIPYLGQVVAAAQATRGLIPCG